MSTPNRQKSPPSGWWLLLFTMGLELSFERYACAGWCSGSALLQVAVAARAAGAPGGWAAAGAAVIVGAALACPRPQSHPGARRRQAARRAGRRASFAVLLFQDLAVAPLLFMEAIAGRRRAAAKRGAHRGLAPGGARARRADRVRPARAAAALPFRRATREPGILHGRLPAGRARHGLAAAASGLSMALGAL